MSEKPVDLTTEILIGIHADIAALRSSVDEKLDGLSERLDKLDGQHKKAARDSAAMLVMMRGTVGVYEERIGSLETRVGTLESARPR